MPSLHDLGEFKYSFSSLGDELRTRAELDLPPDDLPLPDHEPAAGPGPSPDTDAYQDAGVTEAGEPFSDAGEAAGGAAESDFMDFGDLGDLLGAGGNSTNGAMEGSGEPGAPSQEDMDFGSFIDNIPDDFSAAENPSPQNQEEADSSESDTEDFGLPPDLLDGFADEIEAERASPSNDDIENQDLDSLDLGAMDLDTQASGNEEISYQGLGNLDMESLPDFESSDSLELLREDPRAKPADGEDTETAPAADSGEVPELAGEADADIADTIGMEPLDVGSIDDGQELGDFPDFDAGESFDLSDDALLGEDTTFDTGTGDADSAFDFSIPEEISGGEEILSGEEISGAEEILGAEEIPSLEEPGAADAGMEAAGIETAAEDDDDNFDLGGEVSDFDTGAVLEEISGDSFDNFKLDANALAGNFDLGKGAEGFGDELSNLEEFSLAGIDSVFDGASAPGAPRTGGRAGGRAAPGMADEVEEISLSDEELEQFQNTLSSYPLNLRIVCEELIAEQAVAPDLMSRLVKLLVNGAPARETAALAGQILGRTIPIPRAFEKKTGEALEIEQTTFGYIFVHNFLPVFRLFMMIALVALSLGYLVWRFIYTPIRAENIYKLGYERIAAGEYSRANDRFQEAFRIHEKKMWFYKYAGAFRDARQYTLAEEKYRQLLNYTASKNKRNIPEKAAVLEYADMESNVIGDYQSADQILRHNLLDYSPFDREALLALGDNSLAWSEYEPSRLDNAREYYALYMEHYGRPDPLLERMLKYFIRADDLGEVLSLQSYFMSSNARVISASTLAEMGGYLLDKQNEKVQGVPNEYLDSVGGIRNILLRAVRQDPMLPESYYHLARYYRYFDNANDERLTLDLAVKVFDAAKEETPKRIRYHINTLERYGEVLINNREFFPAEENLIKGVNLYKDALSRRLVTPSPEFGRLYADLGDLEYFVKDGDMQNALDYYRQSETNGYAPPEIQYRMGSAYYQLRQWGPAQEKLLEAFRDVTPNRRILYALGNVSYMRGNYFAAQAYYERLIEMLESDRSRLPPIMPTDDAMQLDLAERLMVAQNNMGVTLEALTERTGNSAYRSRAQGYYADSQRAWDILTRNPDTMMRMRPSPDITAPGINPAYLNIQNSLRPVPGYEPQFFIRIDKDIMDSSSWEDLAPPGYRLSEGIGR